MKRIHLVKHVIFATCVGACVAATPVFADEAEAPEQEALPVKAAPEKYFYPLVRCDEISGAKVEVFKPKASAWEAAAEKQFYPLGSAFRVTPLQGDASRAVIAFGAEARVVVSQAAEFATRPIAIGEASRVLELRSGQFDVTLPRAIKDGLFSVAAPHFTCYNMAGESSFAYAAEGDGDEARVRVVTGSLAVKGRHYEIPRMGAANRICIRTTKDALFTSIRGESGDCLVKLDQGLVTQKDYETGETKEVAKTLEFQLSPLCAIKIFRAVSKVGGRTAVSMMTFAANGQMMNRCAFAESRANVNSGELVVTPKAIKDADRKASESEAEATEAVDVAATEEGAAEDKKEASADE